MHVYRPAPGAFWRDKTEMCNAVAHAIDYPCTMVQVDADEMWDAGQLETIPALLASHARNSNEPSCAYFHCHFFLAPDLVTTSLGEYSHRSFEWLRAWQFRPGMQWIAHAPPTLAWRDVARGEWKALHGEACVGHEDTAAAGLAFSHHAYVTEEQVRFKEKFYGYDGALAQWRALSRSTERPVCVSKYLRWVSDVEGESASCKTWADSLDRAAIVPHVAAVPMITRPEREKLLREQIAAFESNATVKPRAPRASLDARRKRSLGVEPLAHGHTDPALACMPPSDAELESAVADEDSRKNHVVIDLVAFQLQPAANGGITRVWTHLLPAVVAELRAITTPFGLRVTLLDREPRSRKRAAGRRIAALARAVVDSFVFTDRFSLDIREVPLCVVRAGACRCSESNQWHPPWPSPTASRRCAGTRRISPRYRLMLTTICWRTCVRSWEQRLSSARRSLALRDGKRTGRSGTTRSSCMI